MRSLIQLIFVVLMVHATSAQYSHWFRTLSATKSQAPTSSRTEQFLDIMRNRDKGLMFSSHSSNNVRIPSYQVPVTEPDDISRQRLEADALMKQQEVARENMEKKKELQEAERFREQQAANQAALMKRLQAHQQTLEKERIQNENISEMKAAQREQGSERVLSNSELGVENPQRMMMSDDFTIDLEKQRQNQEMARLEREQARLEAEEKRIEDERRRKEMQEEHMEKLRQHQRELEERVQAQQAKLEEERIAREQALKEREDARQALLEAQREAMEQHRIEMENHRIEMDAAQRELERENMEKFRANQEAQEERLKAHEQQLREQEAAQREFEAAQREAEKAQRELDMAGNNMDIETNSGRILLDSESIQIDACSENKCQNSGICKASDDGSYVCECNKPFIGKFCETVWENPCNEENLRTTDIAQFADPWNERNYIICSDINVYHSMPCSTGTYFNEDYGHCVRKGYNPPVCPRNYCKNDAECIMDENKEFRCICKLGFTGEFCEENIDECAVSGGNEACNDGKCIDQLNGFYCECSNGIGLDCNNTILNPCTSEAVDQKREFFILPSHESRTFLQCTSVGNFVVSKCREGLFWNQEERACVVDRPSAKRGVCKSYPCQNGGECQVGQDDTEYTCNCKPGYEGDNCEFMIDSCASNPCQNGGRCLAYAGGYTCACPDKIIDECCCHGIKNPCPSKSMLIPGINNYFPHIYKDRYIHCDFDGRAFARNCSDGLVWSQRSLSCLPDNFVVEHIEEEIKINEPEKVLFVDEDSIRKANEQERKSEVDLENRTRKFLKMSRAKALRFMRRI